MRPLVRRTSTAAVATALLLGGVAALASPASAVGSSACTRNDKNNTRASVSLSSVPVRTGPGSQYKKATVLEGVEEFRVYCSAKSKAGKRWNYGKVLSGSTAGKKGWVYDGNLSRP
ncbi:hypothetical protein [Streptomyces sp. WAC01526]|uniref:hypothetical protein n=1 Tax=Streptomyces sp. WAC01526 TaxID=2588709 RepID=UPI0011DFB9C1|nr:hypothetical protein [Streptomyces sp. WAC01526]